MADRVDLIATMTYVYYTYACKCGSRNMKTKSFTNAKQEFEIESVTCAHCGESLEHFVDLREV